MTDLEGFHESVVRHVSDVFDVPREMVCPEGCRHPAHHTDAERLREDLALYGNAYTVNGKRVPPEDVVVHQGGCCEHPTTACERHGCLPQTVDNLQTELCKGVETTIRGQGEFLTMLDELLDDTLHDDHCYIHPNDTVCVCIIGRIRAVLPPCGAVVDKGNGVYWKCVRNSHPSSPDRHTYG